MALGWYEITKAKDGQFHFNLKAANGEIILSSELYTTHAAAEKGIHSVQVNGGDKANFEIRTSKADKAYFVLKAKNHQIIGQSQFYKTEAGAKNGIESITKNAGTTVIKDHSKEES